MKIIDLLNKIANGEEVPNGVIYEGTIYRYIKDVDYKDENGNYLLSVEPIEESFLNNEVEILDESIPEEIKKIEKPNGYSAENYIEEIFDSVNELIDVVNKQNKCIEEFKKLKEELEKQ